MNLTRQIQDTTNEIFKMVMECADGNVIKAIIGSNQAYNNTESEISEAVIGTRRPIKITDKINNKKNEISNNISKKITNVGSKINEVIGKIFKRQRSTVIEQAKILIQRILLVMDLMKSL